MMRGGVRLILISSIFLCVSIVLPRLIVMHEIKKATSFDLDSDYFELGSSKSLNIGVVAHQEHNESESKENRGIDMLLEAGFSVKKMFLLGDEKKISKNLSKDEDIKTGVPIQRLSKMQQLASDPDFSKIDVVFYDMPANNSKPLKEPLFSLMSQMNNKKLVVFSRKKPNLGSKNLGDPLFDASPYPYMPLRDSRISLC